MVTQMSDELAEQLATLRPRQILWLTILLQRLRETPGFIGMADKFSNDCPDLPPIPAQSNPQ